MAWINRQEREPKKEGAYKVRMRILSMSPTIKEFESYFMPSENKAHRTFFRGEGLDNTYVIEWWEEDNKID